MNDEVKVRVFVTKGTLVLAELHSEVTPGIHEFVFQQPIRTPAGRHFEGFSLDLWIDQEPQHVIIDPNAPIPRIKR